MNAIPSETTFYFPTKSNKVHGLLGLHKGMTSQDNIVQVVTCAVATSHAVDALSSRVVLVQPGHSLWHSFLYTSHTIMSTTTIPITSNHYMRDLRMTGVGNQTRDKFIGPIEPTQFLEEFLPIPVLPTPEFGAEQKAKFRKASEMSEAGETAMYEPLILAMTEFCPTLSLSDTHKYSDNITWARLPGLIKPDICARPTLSNRNEATDISTTELCLEVTLSPDDDFDLFEDPVDSSSTSGNESPLKAVSRDATDVLAQLATYAGAQLASQPRTHCFSVHFTRHHARLFRWDRSGAIVTRRFSFAEETHLVEFLWRYSHAARQDQGYDSFVTQVGENDGIDLQNVRCALKLDEDARIWRFQVISGGNDRFFYGPLIPPRDPSPCIPTGKCTRGSPVVDENGEVAYLKETWREIKPHAKTEGEVYETLHAANVSNIPTVIASGDAKGKWQRTVTKFGAGLKLKGYQHYFIVFREVGRSLNEYVSLHELVNAFKDAIQAHHDAYTRVGILHRDVSLGNILITKAGGLLIDWDLSMDICELENNELELTGTWQFISARLLSTRTPQGVSHMLADDLESFYHVLCYLILLSGQHNLSPSAVSAQISYVYNHRWIYRGRMIGGTRKIVCFKDRWMTDKASLVEGAVKDLVVGLEDMFARRYNPDGVQGVQELSTHRWILEQFNNVLLNPGRLKAAPVARDVETQKRCDAQEAYLEIKRQLSGSEVDEFVPPLKRQKFTCI